MGQAGEFDGKRYVDVGNVGNFGFYDAFTLSAWIYPAAPSGTIVSRAHDEAGGKGFGLVLKDGHLSREPGAALAGRRRAHGERSSRAAEPLVAREPHL